MDIKNLHITLDFSTLVFVRRHLIESIKTLNDPFALQQLAPGVQYSANLITEILREKGYVDQEITNNESEGENNE